jgi:hypothetical protein
MPSLTHVITLLIALFVPVSHATVLPKSCCQVLRQVDLQAPTTHADVNKGPYQQAVDFEQHVKPADPAAAATALPYFGC